MNTKDVNNLYIAYFKYRINLCDLPALWDNFSRGAESVYPDTKLDRPLFVEICDKYAKKVAK